MIDRHFTCYIIAMILVLTPLAFENDSLRTHLGKPTQIGDQRGIRVHHYGNALATAAAGHGKVQFALGTQMLIRELAPKLVICAGACGAIRSGLEVGDVIAAEFTVEHDFNLRFEKRPLPRFKGDDETLRGLKNKPDWPEFKIHFGTIASGDEDIVDAARAVAVHALTEGLAVAWEGAGGARAAAFCKTPYLELRAVTDLADAKAPQDFKSNVQTGMRHIAHVLNYLSHSK